MRRNDFTFAVIALAMNIPRMGAAATATEFVQTAIYHSPQTPGYTAWCTLWRTRDGQLRLAFQQITGPVENWKKRRNVTVILGSNDEAKSWKKIREVPARTNTPSDGDKAVFKDLPAGSYELAIGLHDKISRREIELPIAGGRPAGLYGIGHIRVTDSKSL